MVKPALIPRSASSGDTLPSDSPPELLFPDWQTLFQAVRLMLSGCSENKDSRRALTELTAIRNQLAECLHLAEETLSEVSERIELQEQMVADTDPVRRVQGARAKRMPDEDDPLPCDPEDHPTE